MGGFSQNDFNLMPTNSHFYHHITHRSGKATTAGPPLRVPAAQQPRPRRRLSRLFPPFVPPVSLPSGPGGPSAPPAAAAPALRRARGTAHGDFIQQNTIPLNKVRLVVTTVLLGLLLTPALAEYFQNQQVTREIRVNGGIQFLSINPELRVVTVEQRSEFGPWKTIWNFNTGFIATELMSQGICIISQMNRNLLPTFETFPTVVQGFQMCL
ncbi:uncharacterized protein [Patagioenas fasciata]|uniref:uncharacterized protein n=1 Tax=Patagioenas fasciata TaxID=372321 RepID=UPI003A9A3B4B